MPSKSLSKYPVKYPTLIGSVVGAVINGLILYYLLGLEKKHCDCTLDKRHDALKILAVVNIGYPILATVLILALKSVLNEGTVSMLWYLITLVYSAILFIGAVILWRYVDRLNRQNCKCAEDDMQNINSFLMIWRWFMVIGFGLTLLVLIMLPVFLARK